jgi:hypothetical protein
VTLLFGENFNLKSCDFEVGIKVAVPKLQRQMVDFSEKIEHNKRLTLKKYYLEFSDSFFLLNTNYREEK